MQKALTFMNIQLHYVISAITGMKIIRAIVGGKRNPDKLAAMRDIRCKESRECIRSVLVDNYQPEHVFALKQSLALYDFYQRCIYGMNTSMSRKGNCWDAPMESFSGTLKTESLHHYRFATREQAKRVVFEYIEMFYDRLRRHAKIGHQVPAEFANQYHRSRQQSAARLQRLARPLNRTPLKLRRYE